MTIDDHIRDEKLQYDINREAAKISALSSGKIDKFEYVTGEEILSSSNQIQILEQAKFTYSPLGKTFEKQIKTIEDQGEKQIKVIQNQGGIKKKGFTADAKFNEFDNGFSLLGKIRDGKISLADEKKIKQNLNQI